MPEPRAEKGKLTVPSQGAALLIVDMISCWDFPDADKLTPAALALAPHIAELKQRCRRSGMPVVYCNDNRGRWRSDFRQLISLARRAGGAPAAITRQLLPDGEDYFVLKPKHSGFFCTPLELLLHELKVRRLLVTGVASDQCILVTASEARMRNFEVIVPSDCVASQSPERNDIVLRQFRETHKLKTPLAADLEFKPVKKP